jgi:hypothetical protein
MAVIAKLKQSESKTELQILIYLSSLRIGLFWKNISAGYFDGKRWRKQANPFAINGVPDILGIVKGRFVGIEVKTKTGVVSENQKAFIKKALELDAVCFVARSVEEVKSNLQSFGLIS